MPAICWHKHLIEEAGGDPELGPRTWPELLEMSRALLKFDDDGNLTQAGYDPKDAYAFTVIAWPVVFDENFISGDKAHLHL